MVGATPRLEYIIWKDVLKKGGGGKKNLSKNRTVTLVEFYCSSRQHNTNSLIYSEANFLILLVSNSLKLPNLIVFFLE